MNNNPLALAVRNAFIKNVVEKPTTTNLENAGRNSIENILKNKRISLFEKAINQFLTNSGQNPVGFSIINHDEKNLLTFSLQLSGYIRDAQKALDKLSKAHACDPDLIKLYKAASKYSADCNHKVEGCKYIFKEHSDYKFWKINNTDTLANAQFQEHGIVINPNRRNLFVSMPFHIKDSQEELQNWSSKFLNESLDNKEIFGSKVDTYLAHFPIEQPRGEKFALCLETIRTPQTYFEAADMKFVKEHFLPFLGKEIEVNQQNKITSGQAFDADTFKQNCANITFLGYCAGIAHTHRWINAFEHLSTQVYDKPTTQEALKNIFVISYAFLPIQAQNKYSGAHFMSNFAEDSMRKEPFIKMFNPELYEASKYTKKAIIPARVSPMPDNRNFIIALKLPENTSVADAENGHHMGLITSSKSSAYPHFKTVLENASLGLRNHAVFANRDYTPSLLNTKTNLPIMALYNPRKQAHANK